MTVIGVSECGRISLSKEYVTQSLACLSIGMLCSKRWWQAAANFHIYVDAYR